MSDTRTGPTQERIAEIRKRRAKIQTKAPWRAVQIKGLGANVYIVGSEPNTWSPVAEHVNGFDTAEFIAKAPEDIDDLLAAVDAQQKALSLGHLRLDECADGSTTKGQPIRERISAKIQSLVEELTERGHIIAACGAEKDELRAQAQSAKHREAAAEYRAQRIVLDAELKQRADAAERQLAEIGAQMEATQAIVEGREPSDFLLSFPLVRAVDDLRRQLAKAREWIDNAIASCAKRRCSERDAQLAEQAETLARMRSAILALAPHASMWETLTNEQIIRTRLVSVDAFNQSRDEVTALREALTRVLNCDRCGGSGFAYVSTKRSEEGQPATEMDWHRESITCPCRTDADAALSAPPPAQAETPAAKEKP